MADTQGGGGGGTNALLVVIIVLIIGAVLYFSGIVGGRGGNGDKDINVKIEAPKTN